MSLKSLYDKNADNKLLHGRLLIHCFSRNLENILQPTCFIPIHQCDMLLRDCQLLYHIPFTINIFSVVLYKNNFSMCYVLWYVKHFNSLTKVVQIANNISLSKLHDTMPMLGVSWDLTLYRSCSSCFIVSKFDKT